MTWILSDGTEIEVENFSNGYNIYKRYADRSEVWSMVDNVIKAKDLSSWSLSDVDYSDTFNDREFIGLVICEQDPELMRLMFATSLEEENRRLMAQNQTLREQVAIYKDGSDAYDILTGGAV